MAYDGENPQKIVEHFVLEKLQMVDNNQKFLFYKQIGELVFVTEQPEP